MWWKGQGVISAFQTPLHFCCPLLWLGRQVPGLTWPPWHIRLILNQGRKMKGWDINLVIIDPGLIHRTKLELLKRWQTEFQHIGLAPLKGGAERKEYKLGDPRQILAGVHKGKNRPEADPRLGQLVHNCHQGELSTPIRGSKVSWS